MGNCLVASKQQIQREKEEIIQKLQQSVDEDLDQINEYQAKIYMLKDEAKHHYNECKNPNSTSQKQNTAAIKAADMVRRVRMLQHHSAAVAKIYESKLSFVQKLRISEQVQKFGSIIKKSNLKGYGVISDDAINQLDSLIDADDNLSDALDSLQPQKHYTANNLNVDIDDLDSFFGEEKLISNQESPDPVPQHNMSDNNTVLDDLMFEVDARLRQEAGVTSLATKTVTPPMQVSEY